MKRNILTLILTLVTGAAIAQSGGLWVDVEELGPGVVSLTFNGDANTSDQRVPDAWLDRPAYHIKLVDGQVALKSAEEIEACVGRSNPVVKSMLAYALAQGADPDELEVPSVGSNGFVVAAPVIGQAYLAYWNVTGVDAPGLLSLPSAADAEAALTAHGQDAKSALHKAADNALIAVLIRGGLVPEGTTELPAGTEDTITLQLLQAEVADPTNAAVQTLSSKLDRLKGIIEKEGGDPDDAVIH